MDNVFSKNLCLFLIAFPLWLSMLAGNSINSSIAFEEHKGQFLNDNGKVASNVLFKASTPSMDIYITTKGISYVQLQSEDAEEKENILLTLNKLTPLQKNVNLHYHKIDVDLLGASIKKENVIMDQGEEPEYNYYLAHCPNGILHVKKYRKIIIKNVYPGIDWVWKIQTSNDPNANLVKYDFVLTPNANIEQIKLAYHNVQLKLSEDAQTLSLITPLGKITEGKLLSFSNNSVVPSSYRLNKNVISFNALQSNKSNLIIDPPLYWATLFGGSNGEMLLSSDCDANGNVFVTGQTSSINFPTKNSGTYFDGTLSGGTDIVIAKFDNNGVLLWATYYGGTIDERGSYIKCDAAGNIFVTGMVWSDNLPPFNGGGYYDPTFNGSVASGDVDAFLLKFDNAGARLWATYLGGNGQDIAGGLTITPSGNLVAIGTTASTNLTTKNSGGYFRATLASTEDAYLYEFTNASAIVWGTYFGGSNTELGQGITCDLNGNLFATGKTNSPNFPLVNAGTYFKGTFAAGEAFLMKFNPARNIAWSTFFGGSGDEFGTDIKVDQKGDVYTIGYTLSFDLPTKNAGTYFDNTLGGIFDAYIAKFDNSGNLIWSTYYGGSSWETPNVAHDLLEVDNCNSFYVCFATSSNNINTYNPGGGVYYDGTFGGSDDLFVGKFKKDGTLLWGTYFGGTQIDDRAGLAVDQNNALFITGSYGPYNGGNIGSLPLTNPGAGAYYDGSPNGNTDGLIAKFKYAPLTAAIPPIAATCSCNRNAIVTAAGGVLPYSYLWSSANQTTNAISGLCAGSYTVMVSDNNCDTLPVTATIAPLPAITTTISSTSASCTTNNNGTATIQAAGGSGIFTFLWSNSASSQTISGLSAGTYSVVTTDNNNCSSVNTVTVSSIPTISYSLTIVNPSCNGLANGSVVINISSPGTYTYLWQNGSSQASVTGLPAGNYSVTISNATGCSAIAQVQLVDPAAITFTTSSSNLTCANSCDGSINVSSNGGILPYAYRWSNNNTTNSISSLCVGSYSLTVTDSNGCVGNISTVITSPATITASVTSTNINCYGNNNGWVQINSATGGISPFTFLWNTTATSQQINNLSPGIYSVTITDANGCTTDTSVLITQPTLLQASITNNNPQICAGQNILLSAGASGGTPAYSFLWSNNLIGSTTIVSPNATSVYSVSVTDANGCVTSDSVTVIVNALPIVTFGSDKQVGCGPLCVTLFNQTPFAQQLTWTLGDGNTIAGADSINHCFLNPGSYSISLTITDSNGCSNTDSLLNYITVYPDPAAAFITNPSVLAPMNSIVQFFDKSIGADSLNWLFGDFSNSTSSLRNPSFSYNDTGAFTITLIAINEYGCKDTAYGSIDINPESNVFVPNTFTPNNDGVNDLFSPIATGIVATDYELLIFDRWGNLIFETNDPSQGWNGKVNGGKDVAQQDTYVWKLRCINLLGERKRLLGHVNLVK